MAVNRQLGLYWGNNSLYFTEILAFKPFVFFNIPLELEATQQANDNKFISNSMNLVSSIENQLKTNKIETNSVNLSLPTKDIIFRSFIIPWMSANEIRGVVTFEISKYIPFSLEELKYSYHPITITVNNTKKIRIIFVAVRKDTLENYSNILESAGLQIKAIEPCSQSIIRSLLTQKLLDKDATIALVEKNDLTGKITIVDQGIPQFVREFQLKSNTKDNSIDQKDLAIRLINEIRISINYFTRQESFNSVSEIKLFVDDFSDDLIKNISADLNIKTTPCLLKEIFPSTEIHNIAYINAFGVGLHNSIAMSSNFDLSKINNIKKPGISTGPSNLTSYKSILSLLLICGGVILFTFFITNQIIDKPRKKVALLESELGIHKDVSIENIQNDTENLSLSLDYLKTFRINSTVTFYITTLPTLLPEGTWIKTLDILYEDSTLTQDSNKTDNSNLKKTKSKESKDNDLNNKNAKDFKKNIELIKPVIFISGYTYSENIREQFKLVNQLLINIRESKNLSTLFNKITLETVKAEKMKDFTVTYFEIRCK